MKLLLCCLGLLGQESWAGTGEGVEAGVWAGAGEGAEVGVRKGAVLGVKEGAGGVEERDGGVEERDGGVEGGEEEEVEELRKEMDE